eukprot:5135466-Pleurochrysis_carterae.AAC.1
MHPRQRKKIDDDVDAVVTYLKQTLGAKAHRIATGCTIYTTLCLWILVSVFTPVVLATLRPRRR